MICDFAQVREGLLFVSSGGITRLTRATLPAPLRLSVAVVVEVPAYERNRTHEVRVTIVYADSAEQVGYGIIGFQPQEAEVADDGESLYVPLVLEIPPEAVTNNYGRHDVRVSVDGCEPRILTFYVLPPPSA